MYCCQVCTTPSKPGETAKKITIFRKVVQTVQQRYTDKWGNPHHKPVQRELLQIEKELLACTLCHDGYRKGIPLQNLAAMHKPKEVTHRPVSATTGPPSPAGGGSTELTPVGANAPRDGAKSEPPEWFGPALAAAQATDRHNASLPPEKRLTMEQFVKKSKADKLLEQQEQGGKRTPKKVKYGNLKKGQSKGKQQTSKPKAVGK